MNLENMFLVSLVSGSKGTLQPVIWVMDPTLGSLPPGSRPGTMGEDRVQLGKAQLVSSCAEAGSNENLWPAHNPDVTHTLQPDLAVNPTSTLELISPHKSPQNSADSVLDPTITSSTTMTPEHDISKTVQCCDAVTGVYLPASSTTDTSPASTAAQSRHSEFPVLLMEVGGSIRVRTFLDRKFTHFW